MHEDLVKALSKQIVIIGLEWIDFNAEGLPSLAMYRFNYNLTVIGHVKDINDSFAYESDIVIGKQHTVYQFFKNDHIDTNLFDGPIMLNAHHKIV
jgi:hypothetical protein